MKKKVVSIGLAVGLLLIMLVIVAFVSSHSESLWGGEVLWWIEEEGIQVGEKHEGKLQDAVSQTTTGTIVIKVLEHLVLTERLDIQLGSQVVLD